MLLVVGRQDLEPGWGKPRAFAHAARSELKWPCDGTSGWTRSNSSLFRVRISLTQPGVLQQVARSCLRASFEKSFRGRASRQHSRMAPKWVSLPSQAVEPRPTYDNLRNAADLYQTALLRSPPEFPSNPDQGRSACTPLRSHYLPTS